MTDSTLTWRLRPKTGWHNDWTAPGTKYRIDTWPSRRPFVGKYRVFYGDTQIDATFKLRDAKAAAEKHRTATKETS